MHDKDDMMMLIWTDACFDDDGDDAAADDDDDICGGDGDDDDDDDRIWGLKDWGLLAERSNTLDRWRGRRITITPSSTIIAQPSPSHPP